MSLNDDIVYVLLLLCSIAFGWVTRRIRSSWHRKWTSSLFGLLMAYAVSGSHTLHLIVSMIAHMALIKSLPVNCVHLFNFIFGFGYLLFFRLCGSDFMWAGLTAAPGHTNAIQMIMSLKLIGLAFEVHDTVKAMDPEELRCRGVHPSVWDIFHYCFSHCGLLTGPYYRFRTFQDMHELSCWQSVDCTLAMLKRVWRVPGYVLLFLLSGHLFPLSVVRQEDFYQTSSFWYRLFYMTPVFFNFRMRLYTGFVLGECSCIMAGLGAYPSSTAPKPGQGPSKLAQWAKLLRESHDGVLVEPMSFDTVHNIDESAAESVPTMREALKSWNMTVQHWLASNVYTRLPGSRELRTIVVMMVSSVWHGVYAGYYLSLCSVALILPVEDLYCKLLRHRLQANQLSGSVAVYDWVSWFVRFQLFSYLGMAFQLLQIGATFRFWQSVLFVGHLLLPALYLVGYFVLRPLLPRLLPTSRP